MAGRSAPAVEQGLAAIAAGDLTVAAQAESVRIANFGNDEIGRMARMVNSLGHSFDSMLTHYEEARTGLSEMIESVQDATEELQKQGGGAREASHSLRGGARSVGQAIEQISSSALETSRGAEATNAAVGQLRRAIDVIANGAADAKKVASEIARKAYWNSSYFGGSLIDLRRAHVFGDEAEGRCPGPN